MKRFFLTLPILLLPLLLSAVPASEFAKPKNFVFFLVDDLGWADVGCNGSTFHETPNIDTLAASGMRFTQGYAAASVCSPTRASIMTGRHPVRVDITDWLPGEKKRSGVMDRDSLALEEQTIAEVLKEAGYQTFFAGKWHLGGEDSLPTDQGFDVNIGGFHVGTPPGNGYYAPWKNPYLKEKKPKEYLTERLTEESVRFMEKRDPARPFLLYLSYYNVHSPIQAYEKRIGPFQAKGASLGPAPEPLPEHKGKSRARQDNPAYASMVAAVDDSVGALLKKLDALGLAEETVVILFSDNGGLCTLKKGGPTCNLPLRAGKGWLYEGGIREPMIIRAPGVTKPGAVCHDPVVSMDFFPTMLDLAGLPLNPDLHADGESLMTRLRGASAEPRTLYWHYPHYHGSMWEPGGAIRDGDWKLVEFFVDDSVELYNLADDPGERKDLAKANPSKADELRTKLHAWRARMKARMPK